MERQDEGMAFLLQYENIAWFDKGKVRILDRRVYPEVKFVTCRTHQEVAQAITDMVTQSCGPYVAAPMGMALAAWECRGKTGEEQLAYLKDAAETISNARPTTKARLQIVCQQCYDAAEKAIAEGREPLDDVFSEAVEINNRRYAKIAKAADYLVDMMPYRGKVMTQCFAETILGAMLREIKKRNLDIKLFCPETRPY
ncbi:MAG: S-methyl-5-thioribose-1-phosphate isomerase, partial [Firmicutes bacterium]|nr:S-methyl-5-thioribose-1-phosphate isomerase [Bacillota bacterium]